MKKTIVIASHSFADQSTANSFILSKLNDLENVQVRQLESIYPDYQINVEEEQKLLVESDVIVFQFPLFWYSVPALLKKWIDEVFTYGFAYGGDGDKLKGKKAIISITTGGPEEAYSATGYNGSTIFDLLLPLRQTINLTQMEFAGIEVSYGMMAMMQGKEIVEAKSEIHVSSLISKLESI